MEETTTNERPGLARQKARRRGRQRWPVWLSVQILEKISKHRDYACWFFKKTCPVNLETIYTKVYNFMAKQLFDIPLHQTRRISQFICGNRNGENFSVFIQVGKVVFMWKGLPSRPYLSSPNHGNVIYLVYRTPGVSLPYSKETSTLMPLPWNFSNVMSLLSNPLIEPIHPWEKHARVVFYLLEHKLIVSLPTS